MGAIVMQKYQAEIIRAMQWLGEQSDTLFIGQSVKWDGQRLHNTLIHVPMEKRIEFPVIEDFQIGYSTGLALAGFHPVTIFPRWDFLLLAANQLVNHLDKLPQGFYAPMIIRVAVGHTAPMDPGPQHRQNHTEAFRKMLESVMVVECLNPDAVFYQYQTAYECRRPVVMVEYMRLYDGLD
jgi:pyruvate/2-oxoglutarate/acetoin dehydrogenase E1 component